MTGWQKAQAYPGRGGNRNQRCRKVSQTKAGKREPESDEPQHPGHDGPPGWTLFILFGLPLHAQTLMPMLPAAGLGCERSFRTLKLDKAQ